MPPDSPLDALPLWSLFACVLALAMCSIECGYRLGRYRRSRTEDELEAPVGAMVGATLGLLAFILAFTFGMAGSRFDTRRQVVMDEANAIGTTWLRAEMLPERSGEIRTLLQEYVDVRLDALAPGKLAEGLRRSEGIQQELWAHAVYVGAQNPHSIVVGLFIQSLNDVIDLHTKRVTAGVGSRIPGAIWTALFAVVVFGLAAMGYHAGLVRTSRSPVALTVAITFTAVILLIADLDRPGDGSLEVSQQAMIDLQRTMRAPGQ